MRPNNEQGRPGSACSGMAADVRVEIRA